MSNPIDNYAVCAGCELNSQNYEDGFVAGYKEGMQDLIGFFEYQADLPLEERKSPEECVNYLLNKIGGKE